MRKRSWVEILISDTARQTFSESDRVVSVRVKNQGTSNALTGWGGTESANNIVLPGTADNFDAGDSGYIDDALTIKFDGAGVNNVILLVLKDSPDNCD